MYTTSFKQRQSIHQQCYLNLNSKIVLNVRQSEQRLCLHWYDWFKNSNKNLFFIPSWIYIRHINTCSVLLISLVSSMIIENIWSPISVWTCSSIKSAVICNNSFWIFQETHCSWYLSCESNLSCNHGIFTSHVQEFWKVSTTYIQWWTIIMSIFTMPSLGFVLLCSKY